MSEAFVNVCSQLALAASVAADSLFSFEVTGSILTRRCLCLVQVPDVGLSLTAVDSGLLSTLQPSQISLSLFLSSPDGATVTGTGVILPYLSSGTSLLSLSSSNNNKKKSLCLSLSRFQTLAVLHKKAEQMVKAVVTVYGKRLCRTKALKLSPHTKAQSAQLHLT